VLAAFGGDRVIWASDWPPLELAATYTIWRSVSIELIAGLAPAERAAVLGANAERIYRLAPDQKRI
jgi:L-fuconolactonase